MNTNVIKVTKLCKQYKSTTALSDFSMTVKKGDIYGLIGANGAGKSTLIKIITGLTNQTSGSLELFNSTNLTEGRNKIGSIIETPTFFPNLSAKENLSYYCKVFGISQENADKFLQKVKLENAANKKFKEFSLGMKQRLGLALALMGNPELVILDEPTNGLDPVGISELREIIKKLNEEGVTFLICSHILSELSQIATKFGIVHNGHFVKELTKEELLELTSDKIIVETTQPEKLNTFLTNKKLPFCENGNIFEIEDKNAKVNDLVEAIVKNKIIIEAIYKKKISLEEVFLDILNNKEEVAQND